jgi:Dockerin type I domain/PEP-CTERM motif
MLINRLRVLSFSAVTLTLLAANAARADIDWILQPSASLSLNAQIGSVDENNNNNITELYNGVEQTDPGTHVFTNSNPYYNFTNGLSTRSVGTFTTVGNSFLTSLNFGAEPAQPDITTAKTVVLTSGNWLPANDGSGTGTPGSYGLPTPQNVGVTLAPIPGYPDDGSDGGRVSIFGSYGTIHSNGTAMAVDATGNFNGQPMGIIGGINVAVNYNGNDAQIALILPATGNINEPDNTNPDGFVTRGTGSTSYQYVLHLPTTGLSESGTSSGLYYNLTVAYNLVAAANLVPGDSNFDGIVNGQDIAAVASHWLSTNAYKLGTGDVTGDGIVNGQDIAMIASHWLATTPGLPSQFLAPIQDPNNPGGGGGGHAAVPEPGTWLLFAIGGVGVWVARRRARR